MKMIPDLVDVFQLSLEKWSLSTILKILKHYSFSVKPMKKKYQQRVRHFEEPNFRPIFVKVLDY